MCFEAPLSRRRQSGVCGRVAKTAGLLRGIRRLVLPIWWWLCRSRARTRARCLCQFSEQASNQGNLVRISKHPYLVHHVSQILIRRIIEMHIRDDDECIHWFFGFPVCEREVLHVGHRAVGCEFSGNFFICVLWSTVFRFGGCLERHIPTVLAHQFVASGKIADDGSAQVCNEREHT